MERKEQFSVYIPTHWYFGRGQLDHLHDMALPGKRALVVISNGKSTKANGYLARTLEELARAGVETDVFDQVEANPLKETAMAGGKAARDFGADFLVALGGGSVMDCTKAIAITAANPGDLWDYVQSGTGKRNLPKEKPLPIVAITTTAGTGSEVDCGGVISNLETHEKVGIVYPSLFPVLSIVDPDLMATVPPKFTAYQGFDALFHSTECYISNMANLMSDMVAETAIRSIGAYLPQAVADGSNEEAREHMAFANTLSGYSMMTSCCTSEHSIEHAMSAYHWELPHGAGLIMISLAYYKYFIEAGVRGERFVNMARFLGKTDADRPEDFLTALHDLQKASGVAELKMSEYGIRPDEFPAMARNAKETMGALFHADPAPLSEEGIIRILTESYK